MRLTRTFGALLLAVVASQAASIVERHGALKVQGSHVVDQAGNPLQLTGMSFYWDIWTPGSTFYSSSVVNWLVSDWQTSVVRVPMAVDDTMPDGSVNAKGGYLTLPAKNLSLISTVVDAAISQGIYVIIDWHEQDAARHTAQAQAFFAKMAKKYGDLPNVIFEIWNEPYNDTVDWTWSDIQTYAQAVIPSIRQYSKNLVIVGTPFYSLYTNKVLPRLDTAIYGSVAYTLHFYACTHNLGGNVSTSKQIPLFVTEWGTSDANGGSLNGINTNKTCLTTGVGTSTPAATWFTSLLDPQKISSCNWSLSNADESSAALKSTASDTGNWAAADLTPSGTWVRNNIRAHCTADPSVCPYEGTYAPAQVLAVPGIIPATATTIMGAVSTEPTQEATGGRNLMSIDSADYVTYSIRAASADILWFKARVADTSGGLILVQIDGATVDTIRVYPTGGVQTWSWADGIRQIPVAAGDHALTLKFVGKGRDLLRLQRLEVVSKPAPITAVPSQISLENFNGPMSGLGLGNLFGDSSGPSLRQGATRSKAYYQVSASVAESLSLSIVAANGGANPASVVVWKKVIPRYVAVDTIVVAPSGWSTWQTLTMSRNLPLDSGTNFLQFTFLGDSGKALVDVGALAIGSVVTQLHPSPAKHSLVSLRREGHSLRVVLPEGANGTSVELLSADGRVWARQTVFGSSSLPLPNTHQPLWVRVRGQSSAVLSVPPGL